MTSFLNMSFSILLPSLQYLIFLKVKTLVHIVLPSLFFLLPFFLLLKPLLRETLAPQFSATCMKEDTKNYLLLHFTPPVTLPTLFTVPSTRIVLFVGTRKCLRDEI